MTDYQLSPKLLNFSELPDLPDLDLAVRKLLAQLPPGKVTTYGQLANALGVSTAAKWIAFYLLSKQDLEGIPAHRVVRADGSLGEYRERTVAAQALALAADSIPVVDGKVDLNLYGHASFETDWPLQRLMTWQTELAQRVSLQVPSGIDSKLPVIGAVDVSYVNPELAVAGYALTDLQTGELLYSATREQPLSFPYISGFLGFRELPAILPLLQDVNQAGRLAEVLIVDGNGTLHARSAGVASHLGVVTGIPTIGVSKTLSFGKVNLEGMLPGETRSIEHAGCVIGTAIRPQQGTHPVFVSPGHQMDLPTATELVLRAFQTHKLPEPQYWADFLSRREARRVAEALAEPPQNPTANGQVED